MTAPLHTRPFNLADAKAGAPYCCCDGSKATVLKWDAASDRFPLIGSVRHPHGESANSWSSGGSFTESGEHDLDLVMTPLGFIDGKPVFVGDKLEKRAKEGWLQHVVLPKWAGFDLDWQNEFRWPAPEPVYPETRMTGPEMVEAGDNRHNFPVSVHHLREARAIANAAIRRAIEDGQVVLPTENRAAREMAIAEAVSKATYNRLAARPIAYCEMGLDLATIIAGVKV